MATEREKRLAHTAVVAPLQVSPQPINRQPVVLEVTPTGDMQPHYSGGGRLNRRDYADLAENSVVLTASQAMAVGVDSMAETMLYGMDAAGGDYGGPPNYVLAIIHLSSFLVLKVFSLWVRSSGAGLFASIARVFTKRGR